MKPMVPGFVPENSGLKKGRFRLLIVSDKKRSVHVDVSLLESVTHGVLLCVLLRLFYVFGFFFTYLFSDCSLSSPDMDFFLNCLDCFLSSEEASLCEGDITLDECTAALKSFKRNKSPGLDATLPCEFYTKFWDLVGPDLVATFNDSFAEGRLVFFSTGRVNYTTL